MKKIILTGGGSAGHVMPNISIIEELQQKDFECIYIGQKNSIEQSIIQTAFPNIQFYTIRAGKLRRYFSLQNFLDIFNIFIAFFQSAYLIRKLKPDIVFSKGGFVPPPLVIAGYLFRVPVYIHESDSSPGLATKLCLPFATKIFVSQESVLKHFQSKNNVHLVKLPIRKFLHQGNPKNINFPNHNKKTLLIMGGSLGAKSLNDFLLSNFQSLTSRYNIIHLTGLSHFDSMPTNQDSYLKFSFVQEELADIYAKADMVICRSGATTLAEISALQIPAILIPLPTSQSRGEQITNAFDYSLHHTAEIIQDEDLNLQSFQQAVTNLDSSKKKTKTTNLPSLIDFFYQYKS